MSNREIPPRTAEQEAAYQEYRRAKDIYDAAERVRSAAPELLDALKELKQWIEDECGAECPTDNAANAIAKAEGR